MVDNTYVSKMHSNGAILYFLYKGKDDDFTTTRICCILSIIALNWHFINYEHDKSHAQLSWAVTKFNNLGAWVKELQKWKNQYKLLHWKEQKNFFRNQKMHIM